MNSVNKTLYIPLYGKSYVSKRDLFIKDKMAEGIWEKEGFPLKGKSKSKWLAYYMGIRAAVFDDWARQRMQESEDAVVIHIGCGLDSRILRVENMGHSWIDIDFPDVIDERRRYYSETDNYTMLAADVRKPNWIDYIPKANNLIVIMEGVSMYMTSDELSYLFSNLCNRFNNISLLMDCYTFFAAKMSKYKNPINDVGVTVVHGIDDPTTLDNDKFAFLKEHCMTPEKYISELHGGERLIFKKLYAGKLAKKLYKLYEYQSM